MWLYFECKIVKWKKGFDGETQNGVIKYSRCFCWVFLCFVDASEHFVAGRTLALLNIIRISFQRKMNGTTLWSFQFSLRVPNRFAGSFSPSNIEIVQKYNQTGFLFELRKATRVEKWRIGFGITEVIASQWPNRWRLFVLYDAFFWLSTKYCFHKIEAPRLHMWCSKAQDVTGYLAR